MCGYECVYSYKKGWNEPSHHSTSTGHWNDQQLSTGGWFLRIWLLPSASPPSMHDGAKEAEKVYTTEMLKLLISYRLFEAALVLRSRKK